MAALANTIYSRLRTSGTVRLASSAGKARHRSLWGVGLVSEVDFSAVPTTPWELESVICLIAGNGNPDEAAVLAAHRFGISGHEMLEYVCGARAIPASLYKTAHIIYMEDCRHKNLNPRTAESIPSPLSEEIAGFLKFLRAVSRYALVFVVAGIIMFIVALVRHIYSL